MNLDTALTKLATRYDLDAEALRDYAAEDEVGGYHSDPKQAAWPMGSLWTVEGQVLYALIRATRPANVLELGTYAGCSTAHIEAALKKNRKGSLVTVDNLHDNRTPATDYGKRVSVVHEEATAYLVASTDTFDFIFEDLTHTVTLTAQVWAAARNRLSADGFLVSHDAAHYIVGQAVRDGIQQAGVTDAWVGLIAPSDCGLAVWRNG